MHYPKLSGLPHAVILLLVLSYGFVGADRAAAQTWIQLNPTGQAPLAASNMNAVYDAAANEMIVFGGGFTPRNNNTTVLSNANGLGSTPAWSQLAPAGTLPAPRAGHTVVYDAAHDRLITNLWRIYRQRR